MEMNTVLEDILPKGHEYKILSFHVIKRSDIIGETQFNMSCRITITNIEQWNYWFQEFCSLSGTSYNKSKSDKEGTNKVKLSGNRKCIHNVKQQNIDVNSDKKNSAWYT